MTLIGPRGGATVAKLSGPGGSGLLTIPFPARVFMQGTVGVSATEPSASVECQLVLAGAGQVASRPLIAVAHVSLRGGDVINPSFDTMPFVSAGVNPLILADTYDVLVECFGGGVGSISLGGTNVSIFAIPE